MLIMVNSGMKQFVLILALVFGCGFGLKAQLLPEGGGARAAALGQAYTAVQGDLWGGLFYNPASLAAMEYSALGADGERRFGLSDLLTARAAGAFAWGEGRRQGFGLGLTTFGFENYNTYRVSAAYGIEALENFHLGARVHYQALNVTGYSSGSAFVADLGFLAEITPELTFGGRAHNINQAKLNTSTGEDVLATTLAVGLAFRPNENVLLAVDVEKNELLPASLRLGAEYQLHPMIAARVGAHTQPLRLERWLSLQHRSP
ncbi:MAG: hypothetical protein R3B47_17750 [Bacteroidia bacterium]